MNTEVFTDVARIGPGIWFGIHLLAIEADTNDKKNAYINYVNLLCDNFKCKTCQPHFRKFIDTHNFRDYWNIKDSKGNDIGFFRWSWELHNAVNKFLKKYQPTLEEAFNYYSNSEMGVCFDCGNGNNEHAEVQVTINRPIPTILNDYITKGDIKPKPFKLIKK